MASLNPSAPNEIVGEVAEAGIPEAERAVKAACAAFGAWSRTPVERRAQLLERVAAIMERRRFELAAVEVYEVGKAWEEADGDIREAMDFCLFYAQQMRLMGRPKLTQQVLGEESYQHYWPRGVALVVAPWNFPVAILTGMVSAAIVTGNTVIMKPAEPSSVTGASSNISINKAPVTDDGSAGFIMTVLPVTIAAETMPQRIAIGKFHGAMTSATPRGQ